MNRHWCQMCNMALQAYQWPLDLPSSRKKLHVQIEAQWSKLIHHDMCIRATYSHGPREMRHGGVRARKTERRRIEEKMHWSQLCTTSMTPVWLFVCKWDVQTALGNSFALQQILEISFHRNGNNNLIVQ